MKSSFCAPLVTVLLSTGVAWAQPAVPAVPINLVVGTQTIGAAYGFSKETRLVETARGMLDMGTDTLKFSLPTQPENGVAPKNLAEVVRLNPSVRTVLAMPFSRFLMWAYPVEKKAENTSDASNLDANYREIYDLTRELLTEFNGTNKTFFIGNWEGDWHLLHLNPDYEPTPAEVEAMIDWAKIRQKAVDDAKRDTPHAGVQVWSYLEVNRVQDAMSGKTRIANAVLPFVNPDFVSYSAYDSLGGDIEKQLPAALDFLQLKLGPKAGLPLKRVGIGEYGFPADRFSPQQQDLQARRVMRVALDWDCAFALYWAFYNNEVTDGKQRGFWMVNDQNQQQPVYRTHQQFFQQARAFVTDFKKTNGRFPTQGEFNQGSKTWLAIAPASSPNVRGELTGFPLIRSHSDNIQADATNPAYFDGDTTRLRRSGADVPGNVVYACQGSKRFVISTAIYGAIENGGSKVRAFVSSDQTSWREIALRHDSPKPSPASPSWKRVRFAPVEALLQDARFLKIELARDANVWSPQLLDVEVRAQNVDFLEP